MENTDIITNTNTSTDTPEVSAAKAKALEAEATRSLAEARKWAADAAQAEIALAKLERSEKAELAKDDYYNIYVFDDSVAAGSVEKCILKLTEWSRNSPNCDIEIIFNSPGGSVIDGMALYDFIDQLKRKGHKITCSSLGMAASMAGILLQAGDVRKMGAEAWILIHEGSFAAVGSVGQVEDTVEWVKKIQDRILDIFAKRSAGSDSKTATQKLNKTQIKRRWHRTDWWLDSDSALKYGFIDEIG